MMIFIAFALGLVISVPLGPLGQMMLNRVIDKGFWHGFSIAILATVADFAVCEFFLVGTVSLGSINPWIKVILQVAGLLFLAYVGIKELIIPLVRNQKFKPQKNIQVTNTNLEFERFDNKVFFKNVLAVISYYFSNPTYLAFWLSFSVVINQKFILNHDLLHYTLFSLFFALGTLSCQYIAILFVKIAMKKGMRKEIMKYISIPLYSATVLYFMYLVTQNLIRLIA